MSRTRIKPDVSRISIVDPSTGPRIKSFLILVVRWTWRPPPRIVNSNTIPWKNQSPIEFTTLSCQKINRF